MIISLDYDETYTEDPDLFDCFIKKAKQNGHTIIIVTARSNDMPITDIKDVEVFYTNGLPKAEHMGNTHLQPHVWIDDSPHLIGRYSFD